MPSTTPDCSAWYSSENAITCGIAPSERMLASSTFELWMRIFRPLKSATWCSGRFALITSKPLSQ